MDQTAPFVIFGNGIVGVTAAEMLRAESPQALIVLIASDTLPVYYRPALKDYLAGRARSPFIRISSSTVCPIASSDLIPGSASYTCKAGAKKGILPISAQPREHLPSCQSENFCQETRKMQVTTFVARA
jgi:hypothetical protein